MKKNKLISLILLSSIALSQSKGALGWSFFGLEKVKPTKIYTSALSGVKNLFSNKKVKKVGIPATILATISAFAYKITTKPKRTLLFGTGFAVAALAIYFAYKKIKAGLSKLTSGDDNDNDDDDDDKLTPKEKEQRETRRVNRRVEHINGETYNTKNISEEKLKELIGTLTLDCKNKSEKIKNAAINKTKELQKLLDKKVNDREKTIKDIENLNNEKENLNESQLKRNIELAKQYILDTPKEVSEKAIAVINSLNETLRKKRIAKEKKEHERIAREQEEARRKEERKKLEKERLERITNEETKRSEQLKYEEKIKAEERIALEEIRKKREDAGIKRKIDRKEQEAERLERIANYNKEKKEKEERIAKEKEELEHKSREKKPEIKKAGFNFITKEEKEKILLNLSGKRLSAEEENLQQFLQKESENKNSNPNANEAEHIKNEEQTETYGEEEEGEEEDGEEEEEDEKAPDLDGFDNKTIKGKTFLKDLKDETPIVNNEKKKKSDLEQGSQLLTKKDRELIEKIASKRNGNGGQDCLEDSLSNNEEEKPFGLETEMFLNAKEEEQKAKIELIKKQLTSTSDKPNEFDILKKEILEKKKKQLESTIDLNETVTDWTKTILKDDSSKDEFPAQMYEYGKSEIPVLNLTSSIAKNGKDGFFSFDLDREDLSEEETEEEDGEDDE